MWEAGSRHGLVEEALVTVCCSNLYIFAHSRRCFRKPYFATAARLCRYAGVIVAVVVGSFGISLLLLWLMLTMELQLVGAGFRGLCFRVQVLHLTTATGAVAYAHHGAAAGWVHSLWGSGCIGI